MLRFRLNVQRAIPTAPDIPLLSFLFLVWGGGCNLACFAHLMATSCALLMAWQISAACGSSPDVGVIFFDQSFSRVDNVG